MSSFYSTLARLAVRRTRTLAIVWLVILIVAGIGASRLEHQLKVGGFSLPGTEFHTASDILADDLKISSDRSAVVVYTSPTLRVTDKQYADAVEKSLARLAKLDSVTKVESFYDPGLPPFVSTNNHTTYALVTLQGSENDLQSATPEMREVAQAPPLETHLVGNAAVNFDVQEASAEDLVKVERFTFPLVAILLVLVFGSVVAASVPLVLGAVSVAVALAFVYLLALASDVSIFALNIGTMIGLGLAIDFSLIMVSRFREELREAPLETALERTLPDRRPVDHLLGDHARADHDGPCALPGDGDPLRRARDRRRRGGVGTDRAAAPSSRARPPSPPPGEVEPARAPAVLLPQRRRLAPHDRARDAAAGGEHRRRPRVLGLLALPSAWMTIRGVTVDVLPASTESRHAVDLVRDEFGQGELAPIFVVVQAPTDGGIWTPKVLEGVLALHERMRLDPRVDHVHSLATLVPNPSKQYMASLSPATIETSPDRTRIAKRLSALEGRQRTTALVVYPKTGPTDPKTEQLLLDLRNHAKEWAPGLQSMNVLVGGEPAQHRDFLDVVYDQFPILLLLSLLVTYVVLMVFFHSLILPLVAIALNLVSLLVSFGALVIVFQWGIGDSLLGFESLGSVGGYTPVMLFSVLFGLSTDYQVFLLTRVREQMRRGLSNEDAIAAGLEQTAGIITAAALVMLVVFGSFAFTGVLVIKEIGVGLAVAVLVDATLVRVVLVPAAMKLLGRWNWWMPSGLDRYIPEIDEGGYEPEPARS